MDFDLLVYAVTDRAWTGEQTLPQQLETALKAGVTLVQLREKGADGEAFLREALEVKKLTDAYGVPLIINDNVEVAAACNASGVHMGQEDLELGLDIGEVRRLMGPDKIIGVTAKTVEQARKAQAAGADYIGSGAVFGSSTKRDAVPMTMERLREITSAVSIPVVAIGGIHAGNAAALAGTGIAGLAVVSGIFGAEDIGAAVRELRRIAEQVCVLPKPQKSRKKVLTIAGSDCSGGAGIQADLKTMTALGIYGMSVITALTAQNTTGVYGIADTEPEFVAKQMDCVFTDIFPDAVKIGMVSRKEIIAVIAEKLEEYGAKNIVLDPVMVSTSGSRLLAEDAMDELAARLLPLAAVMTPNIPEAELLAGIRVETEAQMEQAARLISEKYHGAVLVKGGHQVETANDVLYRDGQCIWFKGKRINNPNTHGTGCTLSSAIACGLAEGRSVEESVARAKEYLSGALSANLDLGSGSGPLDHCFSSVLFPAVNADCQRIR